LKTPNVVELYGFGITTDKQLFLVEGFYDKSVKHLCSEDCFDDVEPSRKRLKSEETKLSPKDIFLACFDVLQVAHTQLATAHLDIKLANILVNSNNKLVIAGKKTNF
jgi:serine/threonine protein kinase